MGLLGRVRHRLHDRAAARRAVEEAATLLQDAARADAAADRARARGLADRALALLDRAAALGFADRDLLVLQRAQALYWSGRPQDALEPAYAAARARPYDVDSRIVHARVRLALGHYPEAEHEYASVLEEFAGDPDATRGRLALALAHGEPFVDGDETEADLRAAADLLLAAWDAAGRADARVATLRAAAPPAVAAMLEAALARRRAARQGRS